MYPTLYHALLDLTGLDLPFLKFLNSFGFFVALAFFAASWTMSMEFKRKEKMGALKPWTTTMTIGAPATAMELITSAFIGFIIGWKVFGLILNFSEATADTQGFLLSMQGSYVGGIGIAALFAWMKYREKEKLKLEKPKQEEVVVHPYQQAGNLTMTAALYGFIGAKLFHLLENPDQLVRFFTHPGAADFFSGLTMYGGLIVGGTMVIRYFIKHGIPPLMGMDATAPGLMLSYAVGRIGCHISGDGDWGINNTAPTPSFLPDWLWAYDYPNNVLGAGQPITDGACYANYCTHLVPTVYPTPLYEIIMCTALFFVLWGLRKKIQVPGVIFFLYLIFNGVERFFIEKIRINTHLFGNVTQAEVISTILVLLGIGGILWVRRLHRNKSAENAT